MGSPVYKLGVSAKAHGAIITPTVVRVPGMAELSDIDMSLARGGAKQAGLGQKLTYEEADIMVLPQILGGVGVPSIVPRVAIETTLNLVAALDNEGASGSAIAHSVAQHVGEGDGNRRMLTGPTGIIERAATLLRYLHIGIHAAPKDKRTSTAAKPKRPSITTMRAELQLGGAGWLVFRLMREEEANSGIIRAKNESGTVTPEASILKSNKDDQRVHATADLATLIKYVRNCGHGGGSGKASIAILNLAGLEENGKVLWNYDSGEAFRGGENSDGPSMSADSKGGLRARGDHELLLKGPIDLNGAGREVVGVWECDLFEKAEQGKMRAGNNAIDMLPDGKIKALYNKLQEWKKQAKAAEVGGGEASPGLVIASDTALIEPMANTNVSPGFVLLKSGGVAKTKEGELRKRHEAIARTLPQHKVGEYQTQVETVAPGTKCLWVWLYITEQIPTKPSLNEGWYLCAAGSNKRDLRHGRFAVVTSNGAAITPGNLCEAKRVTGKIESAIIAGNFSCNCPKSGKGVPWWPAAPGRRRAGQINWASDKAYVAAVPASIHRPENSGIRRARGHERDGEVYYNKHNAAQTAGAGACGRVRRARGSVDAGKRCTKDTGQSAR